MGFLIFDTPRTDREPTMVTSELDLSIIAHFGPKREQFWRVRLWRGGGIDVEDKLGPWSAVCRDRLER